MTHEEALDLVAQLRTLKTQEKIQGSLTGAAKKTWNAGRKELVAAELKMRQKNLEEAQKLAAECRAKGYRQLAEEHLRAAQEEPWLECEGVGWRYRGGSLILAVYAY